MFNNPWHYVLLIGGIVLVAVVLILYFVVFRERFKNAMSAGKDKKTKKQASIENSQSLASNMFKEEQEKAAVQKEQLSDAEVEAKLNRLVGSQLGETQKPLQQKVHKKENNDLQLQGLNAFDVLKQIEREPKKGGKKK